MTGLLSPVALFLPGTTHDYAIWQAGPSILSRSGLLGGWNLRLAAALLSPDSSTSLAHPSAPQPEARGGPQTRDPLAGKGEKKNSAPPGDLSASPQPLEIPA